MEDVERVAAGDNAEQLLEEYEDVVHLRGRHCCECVSLTVLVFDPFLQSASLQQVGHEERASIVSRQAATGAVHDGVETEDSRDVLLLEGNKGLRLTLDTHYVMLLLVRRQNAPVLACFEEHLTSFFDLRIQQSP